MADNERDSPNDPMTFGLIFAQLQAINAKIDASRAEGEARGHKQSQEMAMLRGDVASLTTRVTTIEGRQAENEDAVRKLRDEPRDPPQGPTAAGLEQAEQLGSALGQIIKLEQAVTNTIDGAMVAIRAEAATDQQKLREEISAGQAAIKIELEGKIDSSNAATKSQLDTQDRVQRGVVAALGLDYQAISAPPPDDPEEKKKHALATKPAVSLKTLSREQKAAAFISITLLTLDLLRTIFH
jgi:hypothetical protein